MAVKQVDIPGIGVVNLYKRRGNRSVKLSVSSRGDVRVSLPPWAPYRVGIEFVKSKSQWLIEQMSARQSLLVDRQPIGKAHHLKFKNSENVKKVTATIINSEVIVRLPEGIQPGDEFAQKVARRTSLRALRNEADNLLPQRLGLLAKKHNFSYSSVRTRHLKSRWGSCSSEGVITLNTFLMELPWPLIDYVLIHELVHTRVLRHGPDFWKVLEEHLPNAKQLRKEIHSHNPSF